MEIAIISIGHINLSSFMSLYQNHEVIAFNIIPEKIEQLNNKTSSLSLLKTLIYFLRNFSNFIKNNRKKKFFYMPF
jgi:UDP-glucose 6-dehydrogenase